ncbi:MAG: glycosyltransferase family 8 protein [Akkermansia sp.]
MNDINVVYASDNNGALMLGVSIQSMLDCHQTLEPLHIFIMGNNLSDENKKRLELFITSRKYFIHYIEMNSMFKDFPVGDAWTTATYYRLSLAECLPLNIDRVLYLDIDVVFARDVSELYHTDFDGNMLAAVETTEDVLPAALARMEKEVGLVYPCQYFNAGVILYNLKEIRELDFEKEVLQYACENIAHLTWQDQDIINHMFFQKILPLHPRWNINDGSIWEICWRGRRSFLNNSLSEQEIVDAAYHPGIIHLWGHPKPFAPRVFRHDYGIFNKAWKRSPWKDTYRDLWTWMDSIYFLRTQGIVFLSKCLYKIKALK